MEAAREAERRAYEHYGLAFTEHYVDVPSLETRIRALEVGSGPPVVVIPGSIGHGVDWTPLLPELAGYTAYVVDRPGGGLSDGIDYRKSPLRAIAARSTAALFEHFDLEAAPLVGNSMGGLWSLRFALDRPEPVSAIALLGTPALYPGTSAPFPMRIASVRGLGGVIVERVMKAGDADGARGTWEFLGHPDGTVRRLPAELARAWARMEDLPHFRRSWVSLLQRAVRLRGAVPEAAFTPDDLREVTSPVSLVWGSDDPFGSVETGRAGAEHFPEAEFHEVGVGHLPWFDEPAACGELVREFFARRG